MKRIAAGVALAFAAQFCVAEDLVIMPGPSIYKCAQWSEARIGALRTPLAMWVFGFVSGSNLRTVENGSQAKVLDNDAALDFADRYCRDHPGSNLAQLSSALIEKFGGPKNKLEWEEPGS